MHENRRELQPVQRQISILSDCHDEQQNRAGRPKQNERANDHPKRVGSSHLVDLLVRPLRYNVLSLLRL